MVNRRTVRKNSGGALTPVQGLSPVILVRQKASHRLQRSFFSFAVMVLSIPLFQTPVFGMDQAVARLKEKCTTLLANAGENGLGALNPGAASTNPELFLAGHTNVAGRNVPGVNRPHTNVPHGNTASKHVNVGGPDGSHFNQTRPGQNSPHVNVGHTNTAHQNTSHTNVTTGKVRT